jgi:hypothetical protein
LTVKIEAFHSTQDCLASVRRTPSTAFTPCISADRLGIHTNKKREF